MKQIVNANTFTALLIQMAENEKAYGLKLHLVCATKLRCLLRLSGWKWDSRIDISNKIVDTVVTDPAHTYTHPAFNSMIAIFLQLF